MIHLTTRWEKTRRKRNSEWEYKVRFVGRENRWQEFREDLFAPGASCCTGPQQRVGVQSSLRGTRKQMAGVPGRPVCPWSFMLHRTNCGHTLAQTTCANFHYGLHGCLFHQAPQLEPAGFCHVHKHLVETAKAIKLPGRRPSWSAMG